MLKNLAWLFGLDRPPPPPPKRRPSARKAKPPAPVAPPAPARPAPHPVVAMLPEFAVAVRTYIRQWGAYGPQPDAARLEAATYVLGRDFAAFLTALHLVNGQLSRFLLVDDRLTDAAANRGLREHITEACYGELQVWADAEKIDFENRKNAGRAGRPIPDPLHVPQRVRDALLARLKADAERLAKGQGGKSGGVKPKPPETMSAPEPVMLDPEGGGRSRIAGAAESSDKAASDDAEGGSPAPKMGGGKRRKNGDHAEETATGIHMPPPPSPDDGEPEGGGYGLPRF